MAAPMVQIQDGSPHSINKHVRAHLRKKMADQMKLSQLKHSSKLKIINDECQ